jgi:peroxiredoxin
LRPGDVAPDFELRRTFEQNVSLSGLLEQGPALIAFYVFDFGHV